MSDVRKFWLKIMVITVMTVGAMHSLVGCIEVGGSTAGVESTIDNDTTSTATQPAAASE